MSEPIDVCEYAKREGRYLTEVCSCLAVRWELAQDYERDIGGRLPMYWMVCDCWD